ncbi:hypothetical protein BG003_000504 [Podila horticola]|nr:hypothetical protein BG003_000504 [Podila horticola]
MNAKVSTAEEVSTQVTIQSRFESPKEPTTAEANRSTAKPQPTAEGRSDTDKPKVLIDDAGIGGLFLRNILLKSQCLMAIHDVVALANWISALYKPKLKNMEAIFAEYQPKRHSVAVPILN